MRSVNIEVSWNTVNCPFFTLIKVPDNADAADAVVGINTTQEFSDIKESVITVVKLDASRVIVPFVLTFPSNNAFTP